MPKIGIGLAVLFLFIDPLVFGGKDCQGKFDVQDQKWAKKRKSNSASNNLK